jgi:hypothetical protein
MVQKEQWYTSWGPKKLIFLIRDKDDAAMAGASVESCQFVVLRSPRGRLGSSRDMCNRLRRMRGRFHRCIHISKVLCAIPLLTMILQSFGSRALWGAPSAGACGLGDHPTPDLSRRASESRVAPEKSVQFGPDGGSFPAKTPITRGPPGIVIAVSSDPILPQR